MSELLSYSETQKLLDELDGGHQKLIADLVLNPTLVVFNEFSRTSLKRVSIRDLATILEGISEACGYTRNIGQITEHVRARLARQLSDDVVNEKGFIPLVTLSPEWEQSFAESIVGQGDDRQLSMAPSKLQQFITAVGTVFERHAMQGETLSAWLVPVFDFCRSVIERFRPVTIVMSQMRVQKRKLRLWVRFRVVETLGNQSNAP